MKTVQEVNDSVAQKNVTAQSWLPGSDQNFDAERGDNQALMRRETDAE